MTTYGAQFNFAELQLSTMDWGFDEGEQADMENFSSSFCTPLPSQHLHSQLALSAMTLTGGHINSLNTNLHHGSSLHQSYPGQLQAFASNHNFMPWHYHMSGVPHPVQQHHQFGHEMSVVYHQPISPVSDIIKNDEDNFSHLHHPTPAYLPPNSFLLSSAAIPQSLFPPLPDSPRSPIKQEREEDYTDQTSEIFMSPLPAASEPAEELMSQEVDGGGDDDDDDADDDDESDHQEPDLSDSAEHTERSLTTSTLPSSDTDCNKIAPYAVLIHRALMSTPKRRMVLAEIYQYFREKIPRFKRMKGRGWMNSIRHNLSMNGAFLKEDRPSDDPGKGYIWVLSEEAEKDGVKSTTRYRKSPPNSKKRIMDDSFLRSNAGKRRRKSTRKWTTAKSRSHSQSKIATIKNNEHHERDPTPPPTPALHRDIPAPSGREVVPINPMGYSLNPNNAPECHTVDYSNCYASFPHFGTSNTLYNSDDDDWRFPGPGDQFSEEYTLVTQN